MIRLSHAKGTYSNFDTSDKKVLQFRYIATDSMSLAIYFGKNLSCAMQLPPLCALFESKNHFDLVAPMHNIDLLSDFCGSWTCWSPETTEICKLIRNCRCEKD